MENSLHIPLDLPNVRVLNLSKTEQGAWLIEIESILSGTTCHQCGRDITDLHCHNEVVRLRHLPIFEIPVYIEIRPKRFRCCYCEDHPTTTQSLEWHEPGVSIGWESATVLPKSPEEKVSQTFD